MHKITKGLKKKKKGKKKSKEEELFKPEELEAYRKQHQYEEDDQQASASGEEWRKFIALTSGVDDILKKTQGDLDRIKSTSFFQRIPPRRESPPHTKPPSPEAVEEPAPFVQPGIVQVSESESEDGEEDDIFDTAYIDAIAAGEVKLAYIPESPTQEQGDDPFDTSIAERAIIGPVSERKGKKLVPIGAAVEVLTGRVQLKTCAVGRPNRRQILKEKDLLLGSFDDNANNVAAIPSTDDVQALKTLLDEDAPTELNEEPIDLSKNQAPLQEFKIVTTPPDDDEFALLAAESLTKTSIAVVTTPESISKVPIDENWAAFAPEGSQQVETEAEDPFDTTFAENLVPGKAELKLIENEILNIEDFDFDPRADTKLSDIINKVSIKVTDPSGQRESISSLDRVSESDLNLIKPQHRDLLGGSNTDLSNLSEQPLKPADQIDENYIEYCDPFDTSIVESPKPGHTELKFLEKELLADIKNSPCSDEDFDPRANEPPRSLSRPDVLNFCVKSVSFDIQSPEVEESSKVFKPLTPFYVRRESVPGEVIDDDPFDTSFVSELGPGKVELKIIEGELFDPITERNLSISDQDFDPRDENKTKLEQVVQSIKDIATKPSVVELPPIDLLTVGIEDVLGKVLTPGTVDNASEEISYRDPFDTSIAELQPGKTELKILETELIHSSPEKVVDLLNSSEEDIVIRNPLNPTISEDLDQVIDPFDTSFASNIAPGRAELKLLESELI